MADYRVQTSLQILKGYLDYQGRPTVFTGDFIGTAKGPVPGALTVPITGLRVNFGELTTPGLCRILNTDATNFVTVGIYDTSKFYPLMELGPGESYVIRLSRYLNQEFVGTGTGTNADVNQFMLFADTAYCIVVVEAFQR